MFKEKYFVNNSADLNQTLRITKVVQSDLDAENVSFLLGISLWSRPKLLVRSGKARRESKWPVGLTENGIICTHFIEKYPLNN